MLPPDHPHFSQLSEETILDLHQGKQNSNRSSSRGTSSQRGDGDQRRTRSSRNLMSFLDKDKSRGKDKAAGGKIGGKHTRSKSSTSIPSIFSRAGSSKSKKDLDTEEQVDKENRTPPPAPIWAQFATQAVPGSSSTTKVPLNDERTREEEAELYSPQDYSPSKQRHYPINQQPTLGRRSQQKPRPKSECLPGNDTRNILLDTVSGSRQDQSQSQVLKAAGRGRKSCSDERGRKMPVEGEDGTSSIVPGLTVSKRGSRVMAAVAVFNGKSKDLKKNEMSDQGKHCDTRPLDPKAVESAFESLLDARNVPQNTKDKMRSLDTTIKADLIKQDRTGSGSSSSAEGMQHSRKPSLGERSRTDCSLPGDSGGTSDSGGFETRKSSRPRSRTFTFNKGEGSPTKKRKSERSRSRQRPQPGELQNSESSWSLSGGDASRKGSFGLFSKANVFTTPDDCIKYLRDVKMPQSVEVGKIHKLRQLLRNETVEWVNNFITQGGMIEIVDLAFRTMAVEWREDHEDTLLHETLSCLKALSTTSLALVTLTKIHGDLFPALIRLLFSEEKKGPSEFTTRTLIIGLLQSYLSSAPTPDIATRARILLAYLKDPSKPEEAQPLGFIVSMHHPRPYRIWQKEISDVTKEVFWIFLHNMNIVPYPDQPLDGTSTYKDRHFPKPHPPIPTAPYIGGVEWDATTYLTTHLDLLNGILAALPTTDERNALRQELKDSAFEKVMGASLRTCKEKFYGSVHEALSTWVGAAREDGWNVQGVREGALPKTAPNSPKKSASPAKKEKGKGDPPKLDMPKLDLGAGIGGVAVSADQGGWL
ncbi:uncharacterized protein KY384_004328 [Bacidia gigantensis]|uniref:uncharacterized protein n=1 Tax=Bacidia gigantensis TaxID=2732470 RepID=UPI001D051755|nr:uncharacterized protein KY384_004328 [Bacidia gigantensis]KAG8530971.1 hypothetical protein KY384_004328 [Bacidia gigantensis]